MVELSVDELTVVFSPTDDELDGIKLDDWHLLARSIAREAGYRAGFETHLGEAVDADRVPAGYTVGMTWGDHPFYIVAAWHPKHPRQGVCLRISAQALAFWRSASGLDVPDLLRDSGASDRYTLRCSRVDLAVDYLDEPDVDVTATYAALMTGKAAACREQVDRRSGKVMLVKSGMVPYGHIDGQEVGTFYLGKRNENTDSMLRVYDKKAEQVARNGTQVARARSVRSWVRSEVVLRGRYAHEMTAHLMACRTHGDLAALVADATVQRYSLMWLNEHGKPDVPMAATAMLSAPGHSLRLSPATYRPSDLDRSVLHIIEGSGLVPLVHKFAGVWGPQGAAQLFEALAARCASVPPSADTARWLRSHAGEYAGAYPSAGDFLDDFGRVHGAW